MISGLLTRGHRVLAPDLVGFGRSDKPAELTDYTYEKHVRWMGDWLVSMDLRAAHFLQEDKPEELVGVIDNFVRETAK